MSLLMKELVRQGIPPDNFRIWNAKKGEPVNQAICQSHKTIVAEAKRLLMPMVIIAEDDVCFPSEFGWWHFLKNIPMEEFDIYLGGVYQGQQDKAQKGFTGMHLYCVHSRFFDKFLSLKGDDGIDNELSRLIRIGECVAKLCWPMAAIQHETLSDNTKTINLKKWWFNENSVYGFKTNA